MNDDLINVLKTNTRFQNRLDLVEEALKEAREALESIASESVPIDYIKRWGKKELREVAINDTLLAREALTKIKEIEEQIGELNDVEQL